MSDLSIGLLMTFLGVGITEALDIEDRYKEARRKGYKGSLARYARENYTTLPDPQPIADKEQE